MSIVLDSELLVAIKEQNVSKVTALLDKNAFKLNKVLFNTTFLFEALKTKNYPLCEKLLQAGCKPDYSSKHFDSDNLLLSAMSISVKMMKLLSEYGADYFSMEYLHEAIQRNKFSAVKYIVNNHTVNSLLKEDVSALISAIQEGHNRITRFLIKQGACLNNSNFWSSPLYCAMYYERLGLYTKLINAGAKFPDLNSKDGQKIFKKLKYYNEMFALLYLKEADYEPAIEYRLLLNKLSHQEWEKIQKQYFKSLTDKGKTPESYGLPNVIKKNSQLAELLIYHYIHGLQKYNLILENKDIFGPVIGISHDTYWSKPLMKGFKKLNPFVFYLDELLSLDLGYKKEELIDLIDGLVVPGSADTVPPEYHVNAPLKTKLKDIQKDIRAERGDDALSYIKQATRRGMPVIGMCWGFHLMWVAQGGKLKQVNNHAGVVMHARLNKDTNFIEHINNHVEDSEDQLVNVNFQTLLTDNQHGQAADESLIPPTVRVTSFHKDGTIKSFEATDPRLSYYQGIQFHPERSMHDPQCLAILKSFCSAVTDFSQRRDQQRVLPGSKSAKIFQDVHQEMKSLCFNFKLKKTKSRYHFRMHEPNPQYLQKLRSRKNSKCA